MQGTQFGVAIPGIIVEKVVWHKPISTLTFALWHHVICVTLDTFWSEPMGRCREFATCLPNAISWLRWMVQTAVMTVSFRVYSVRTNCAFKTVLLWKQNYDTLNTLALKHLLILVSLHKNCVKLIVCFFYCDSNCDLVLLRWFKWRLGLIYHI